MNRCRSWAKAHGWTWKPARDLQQNDHPQWKVGVLVFDRVGFPAFSFRYGTVNCISGMAIQFLPFLFSQLIHISFVTDGKDLAFSGFSIFVTLAILSQT